MAPNIKNPEPIGKTRTEASRRALEDRKAHLHAFLEQEIWSAVPKKALGHRVSRAEEDEILGYGPEGV